MKSIQKLLEELRHSGTENQHQMIQEFLSENLGSQEALLELIQLLTKEPSLLSKNQTPDLSKMQQDSEIETRAQDFSHTTVPRKDTANTIVLPDERYKVLEYLGEGGMGIVQLVQDNLLKREVALKTIKSEKNFSNELNYKQQMMLWRLNQEAEFTAVLEHPNIVPLYDMARKENGELSFTMRKVQGETLREIFRKKRGGSEEYSEDKLLSILSKVCDAVGYAHSKGMVHRDLKPENIMVGQFGEVYVMDWGIAKRIGGVSQEKSFSENILAAKDNIPFKETFAHPEPSDSPDFERDNIYKTVGGIGTPGYMPPEQEHNASNVTIQADIYALGRILKECFTFLSPIEEFQEIIKHNAEEVKKTSSFFKKADANNIENLFLEALPHEIKAIFNKATEKEPHLRYQTTTALTDDIERYQKNIRVSVKEYTLFELGRKWLKRNKEKVIIFLLILFIVGMGLLLRIKEKQANFEYAFQQFHKTHLTAAKMKAEELQEKREKIQKMVLALNFLNRALAFNASSKRAQNEKKQLGKKLLKLCYSTQDYQLANYIVNDLKLLSSLTFEEKQRLIREFNEEKNKRLNYHLTRLDQWIKILADPEKGMREAALLEISKMQEKEVFEKLKVILTEGKKYFLEETKKTPKKNEFYETMAIAFGSLENPNAKKPLLETLQEIAKKQNAFAPKSLAEVGFMVALVQALEYSKAKNVSNIITSISQKMGEESLFAQRVESINKRIAISEGLHSVALREMRRGIKDFFQTTTQEKARALGKKAMDKWEIGEFSEALKMINEALVIDSTSSLLFLYRAQIKMKLKDAKGSLEDFRQAIKLNPQYTEAYRERGKLKRDLLGDFKGAIEDYNSTIRSDPKSYRAFISRGILKLRVRDYNGALADFDQAVQLNPQKFSAYRGRATAKIEKGDFQGALADYNESIRLRPKDSNSFFLRGVLKKKMGNQTAALQDFNQAIKFDPAIEFYYLERGLIRVRLHQKKAAKEDFAKYLEITKKKTDPYTLKNRKSILKRYPELGH